MTRRCAIRPHRRFEHDAEHAELFTLRDEKSKTVLRARYGCLRHAEIHDRDRRALEPGELARKIRQRTDDANCIGRRHREHATIVALAIDHQPVAVRFDRAHRRCH